MGRIQAGIVRGSVVPFSKNVATSWKGVQVLRSFPARQKQIKSNATTNIRSLFNVLVGSWATEITQTQKDLWEVAANRVNQNTSLFFGGSFNIIPAPRGPFSGFTLFVSSNERAFTRGLGTFFPEAPTSVLPFPNPPFNVSVTVAGGVATVTWTDPDTVTWPSGALGVVAIWTKVQGPAKVYPQISVLLPVPTPQTATIQFLRIGRTPAGGIVPLGAFSGGQIFVQMDTVLRESASNGPLWSAPSNVANAVIV